MFRFDNYMEQWATKYKPLSHDPARHTSNRRFYRMDSISRFEEFAKSLTSAKSPSVAAVTQRDTDVAPNKIHFYSITHRCFFWVKEAENTELAAADAKAEASDMAYDFLAWLEHDKKINQNKALQALNIGSASIMTIPTKYNGWWAAELIIEQLLQRNMCAVKPELYTDINTITV